MREIVEWQTFEGEFGPVTLHERIDHAAALIAWAVFRAQGSEAEFEDFLPRWGTADDRPSAFDFLNLHARKG